MKVIKLKKLINEDTSGLTKREFGDPLPTFKDVMEKHQADLDDEEKIKFFNYVDKNWSAEKETD